ncbi:MAG: two-component sensor histidine kinase, partial [Pyrinomonadaceae bacterium]|nr:two-component sensor histidine kinase [Pyrinomonadaceae bacterium]
REAFARASHAEALRQSEQLKSALLDAVTHDLRTPLTSIKASASALLEDAGRGTNETLPLDAEGRQELLAVIDEEADRLNRFVEGLVEMARIEAGEMHLRRAWGGVDEIIAAALARAGPLTAQHHIEVAVEDELPSVRVDARAVAEVIYTLIDNATKFAPRGTTVRITAARAPGETIQIAVEDEGAGVPIEMRESIFQKFSRVEQQSGVQNRPAGLGMGLAIARGIVEAHGGRIQVEDAGGGRGARFVFTAPVGDEDNLEVNHE